MEHVCLALLVSILRLAITAGHVLQLLSAQLINTNQRLPPDLPIDPAQTAHLNALVARETHRACVYHVKRANLFLRSLVRVCHVQLGVFH